VKKAIVMAFRQGRQFEELAFGLWHSSFSGEQFSDVKD
jgi:hypothetical protein